ncbi:MAG TPA: NADPH:quinone oxidoreductase family protein [Ktedonobacterales bacterium]
MTEQTPTMRAIRYQAAGGPEVLALEEVARPEPATGQALVRIAAAGVNYADIARRYNRYLEATPFPYIPGAEFVGEIVALGPDTPETPGLRVGARVVGLCASGGYAEYVATSLRGLAPAPDGPSDTDLVALPVQGVTAYHLLKTCARLAPGERVLVNAAGGGVGVLAIQVARLLGAGKIIAAAGSDEKAELARSLGAHEFINYRTEYLTERVKALTDGKGADVILEPVGGDIYHQSEQALAPFGRLVVFGAASGQPGLIDPLRLMRRNASVVGFWLATLPGKMIAEGMGAMIGWLAQGELRIISGGVYSLEEAAQAQRDMEGRRTHGKLALVMTR